MAVIKIASGYFRLCFNSPRRFPLSPHQPFLPELRIKLCKALPLVYIWTQRRHVKYQEHKNEQVIYVAH